MLLRAVEAFLTKHDIAATKFGRLAARDPRFVLDLRMGRTPRPRTEARIRGWMAEYEVAAKKAARKGTTISQAPAPIAGLQYKANLQESAHV